MDENAKIELFGVKELQDFFEEMRRADQRRIITDAMRIGTKPLITAARALLRAKLKTRSKTNNLKKSIGFVAGRNRGKTMFITSKVGARRFGTYKGYHGHLLDAGTTSRKTRAGFDRGKMKATGFFTDAATQTEPHIIKGSSDHIIEALDKYIQRKLKQKAKAAATVQ